MSEFTNYLGDIHVMRYLKDMEAAKKQKLEAGLTDDSGPKYTQEPILFKPMIRDMLHGGTLDRVFSKAVAYQTETLRCSDSIMIPSTYLDLLEPKQQAQARALLEKGLLIVSICSATTFFSKRNKIVKEAKSKYV